MSAQDSLLSAEQLDALRELASIGAGSASMSLSMLLGHPVDVSLPNAALLSIADAVEAAGRPDARAEVVVLPIVGEVEATALMLLPAAHEEVLCGLLGVEAGTEVGRSALREVANIVGTAYVNVLASMTGLEIEPSPPMLIDDMLGAIVSSTLVDRATIGDTALLLDSTLDVAGEACSMTLVLLPTDAAIHDLLARLGLLGVRA